MERLEFLEREIPRLSQLYYEGKAEVSDYEFDQLIEELKRINPSHELLKKVGWGYTVSGRKEVIHKYPITGISFKIRTYEEINSSLHHQDMYIATPKYDGGSVVIYYKDNKLIQAISRGNGIKGVDITNTILQLNSVPKEIKFQDELVVRGEIVIPFTNDLGIEGNIRNAAIGYSQRVDFTLNDNERDGIKFIPYTILNLKFSKEVQLDILRLNGFIPSPYVKLEGKEIVEIMQKNDSLLSLFPELQVPIDGIVLDNFNQSFEPIAWKLDSEVRETTVIDIDWQLSPNGKFTPVLWVDEVDIDGAKINRVTANSYEFLDYYKAGVGARVKIIRSGMVIPKLIETVTPSTFYKLPEICPECGKPVEKDGAHIFCKNPNCNRKIIDIEYQILGSFRPKGMGDNMTDEMLEFFHIGNLESFSRWVNSVCNTPGIFTELVKESVDLSQVRKTNFIQFINNISEWKPELGWLISIANIPNIGDAGITIIGREVQSIHKSMKISMKDALLELINNDSLSEKLKLNSLASSQFNTYKFKISKVLEIFETQIAKKDLVFIDYELLEAEKAVLESNLPKICLTNLGGCQFTKKQFDEKWGSKFNFVDYVDSTVSKVVYQKSGSSKMKKAEELGIECIQADEFIKTLGE